MTLTLPRIQPRRRAPVKTAARLLIVLAFFATLAPLRAHAQLPVVDDRMVSHNGVQTGQQVLESIHESQKVDVFLRLLLKVTGYEGRDLDGAVAELEAILAAADVLGYTRPDLEARFEATFPGYADRVNWAEHHAARLRQIHSTYRAVLLSLQEQQRRWPEDLDALEGLRRRVTGTVRLGDPDGEGSKQTMMEVRAAARLLGQEETMMIRQALLNRALMRTLALSNAAHLRGTRAATLERMLGAEE